MHGSRTINYWEMGNVWSIGLVNLRGYLQVRERLIASASTCISCTIDEVERDWQRKWYTSCFYNEVYVAWSHPKHSIRVSLWNSRENPGNLLYPMHASQRPLQHLTYSAPWWWVSAHIIIYHSWDYMYGYNSIISTHSRSTEIMLPKTFDCT